MRLDFFCARLVVAEHAFDAALGVAALEAFFEQRGAYNLLLLLAWAVPSSAHVPSLIYLAAFAIHTGGRISSSISRRLIQELIQGQRPKLAPVLALVLAHPLILELIQLLHFRISLAD